MLIKGSRNLPLSAPLTAGKDSESARATPDAAVPDAANQSAAKTMAALGRSFSHRLQTKCAQDCLPMRALNGRPRMPTDGSAVAAGTVSSEYAHLVLTHGPCASPLSPAIAATRYFFGSQQEISAAHEYLSKHMHARIGFNELTVADELALWGDARLKMLGRCGF